MVLEACACEKVQEFHSFITRCITIPIVNGCMDMQILLSASASPVQLQIFNRYCIEFEESLTRHSIKIIHCQYASHKAQRVHGGIAKLYQVI